MSRCAEKLEHEKEQANDTFCYNQVGYNDIQQDIWMSKVFFYFSVGIFYVIQV